MLRRLRKAVRLLVGPSVPDHNITVAWNAVWTCIDELNRRERERRSASKRRSSASDRQKRSFLPPKAEYEDISTAGKWQDGREVARRSTRRRKPADGPDWSPSCATCVGRKKCFPQRYFNRRKKGRK
jgi:hypothetical protein